jgi:hypothetical protein
MSLTVTPEVVAQAERGELSLEAFVEVVRTSLPYFYERVERLAGAAADGGVAVVDDTPATDTEWNELLRGFASDPIRAAMEEHFGLRLGFRNCCFAAATRADGEDLQKDDPRWTTLFTRRAQILAQSPSLVNC